MTDKDYQPNPIPGAAGAIGATGATGAKGADGVSGSQLPEYGDDSISVTQVVGVSTSISLTDLDRKFRILLLNYVTTLGADVPPGLEHDFERATQET